MLSLTDHAAGDRVLGSVRFFAPALPTIVAPATATASNETGTIPTGQETEITEANWRHHPRIKAIRKIVNSVNAGLQKGGFKTAQRKFESCGDQYLTRRRIARDSKGAVAWYEDYSEGEDSSWAYHYYYYDPSGLGVARRDRCNICTFSAPFVP